MRSALRLVVTHRSKRLVKVGLSGMIATAIDVVTLIALVELLGSHVTIAAFLAAVAGGVGNFAVNKYWAFKDRSPVDLRQVASYAIVSLVTAMFVASMVHVLAVLLGVPYLLAKAIAAALAFILWSYPAQSRLVFRAPRGVGLDDLVGDELDDDYDDDLGASLRDGTLGLS
jgi:putative flippase GtrA